MYFQHLNCSASHGVQFRPTCHAASCQQHHSTSQRSLLSKTRPISICHGREHQSSLREKFQLRQESNEMRSETVGDEACLASCPTEYCTSGQSTDRNNKRPTCVRKYECSSRSSGVSFMTRSFTPAVAHFLVEFASPKSCTMSPQLIINLHPLTVRSNIVSNPEISPAACLVPGSAHLSRA